MTEAALRKMILHRDRDPIEHGRQDGSQVASWRPSTLQVRDAAAPLLMQSFFIPGPLPGANDIIRKHWRVYSKLKADWGLTCARCMLLAKIQPVRACAIRYQWIEPTPVRGHIRDRDNIRFGAKFINDALVSQGILLDDGPDGVVSLTDSFTYDGVTPGVLVTIEEVKP